MAKRILVAFAGLLLVAVFVASIIQAEQLPDGPVPVAWDREACAHCHMHVGEPAFAAQLQTTDGGIHHFDDPGCLLLHLEERKPAIHAMYFHHVHEDRWIPGGEVAFAPASPTPMGHGLGAVDSTTEGALSLEQAAASVRAGLARGMEMK